jgi:hypothetical protein
MKKLILFLGALLTNIVLHAQTVVGGCTSVQVTSSPYYDTNLIISGAWKKEIDPCIDIYFTSPPTYATPRHWLEMQQPDGSWVTVQGGVSGVTQSTFNVSTHGTYRVKFRVPQKKYNPDCSKNQGYIQVISAYTGAVLGWRGEFSNVPGQGWYTSNEVVVGATRLTDVAWHFDDPNGNGLFYPGQPVIMNTSGSKNYETWWLAIWENGGQGRYYQHGWTHGKVNSINLSQLVGSQFPNTTGGVFDQIPVSYTVQFALTSICKDAPEWPVMYRNFAVCSGCRMSNTILPKGQEAGIVAPNPASNVFRLSNISEFPEQCRLELVDTNGRTVKTFKVSEGPEFDISELGSGLYFVNVWNEGQKIVTSKLAVLK